MNKEESSDPHAGGISREAAMVVIRRDESGKPTVWCDPEIADLVTALNAGGIATVASCSGHGVRAGIIILADGRELVIVPDWEAGRRLEQLTKNHHRGRVNGIQPDVVVLPYGEGREEVAGWLSDRIPGLPGWRAERLHLGEQITLRMLENESPCLTVTNDSFGAAAALWHILNSILNQQTLAAVQGSAPDNCEHDSAVWALIDIAQRCGAKKDEDDNSMWWTLNLEGFYKLEEVLRDRVNAARYRESDGAGSEAVCGVVPYANEMTNGECADKLQRFLDVMKVNDPVSWPRGMTREIERAVYVLRNPPRAAFICECQRSTARGPIGRGNDPKQIGYQPPAHSPEAEEMESNPCPYAGRCDCLASCKHGFTYGNPTRTKTQDGAR